MNIDEVRIRNMDRHVVQVLDGMAEKRGMSRSEYLKSVLTNHALVAEVKELDDRYWEMFKIVLDSLEANAQLLHEILVTLQGEEK